MFDEKIAMILLPVWLATVLVTLTLGLTRPKLYRIVTALLNKNCDSPQAALDREALGISSLWESLLLRPTGALRRLVKSAEEEKTPSLRVPTEEKQRKHYYLPTENREKANLLYGRKPANIWQSLALSLLLTAVFFVLWILASLVFDTSSLPALFQ